MKKSNPLSLEYLTGLFRTSTKNPNRIVNREGTTLEFKETYNHANMAQYFKTIASFANNTGGYIIFGIGDKPRELKGLQGKSLQQFESLKVEEFTKNLLDYFSPEIKWDHCTFEFKEKSYGVIYIYQSENKPCICKKHYNSQNQKYSLIEVDIFYRYGGRSEKIRYAELTAIIDERRKKEEAQWLDFAHRAAQIGVSNACLLDMASGKIAGNGGTVVLDKELLDKIAFIKEGEFVETKGKPTLRLIGDIQEVNTGRIVVKETTKRVLKAIEPNDILLAFLNNDIVDEPLEYIKTICFATSANFPIYFLLKQSKLPLSEVIDAIDNIKARGIVKKNLLLRLNGKVIEVKSPSNKSTDASRKKQSYRNGWLSENLPEPIENISYCIDALLTLTDDEMSAHEQYIKRKLRDVFQGYYENAKSIDASNIRKAICRIDEALNL